MRPRTAVLALTAVAIYPAVLRGPILTWGATTDEAAAELPGDDLLPNPDGGSTRAIGIDAPPSAVWPWLAQMGPYPRGGVYTYDWIENLLGLDIHSVDHLLPEFQHPRLGDAISCGANTMRIAALEPDRALVFRSDDGNWIWAFVLRPDGPGTRLISRNRFRLPTLGGKLAMLPMEAGSLVMERRMLLGIRRRAERLAAGA